MDHRVQDALDEEVDHQLAEAAGVAGGLGPGGVAVQGGVDGDTVLDRHQDPEPAHHVGGGAEGDVAVGLGTGPPLDHGGGVELGGRLLQPPDQPPR